MKYVTVYEFREKLTTAEQQALLTTFAGWSPEEGVTMHQFVARVDGRGGFVVGEADDVSVLHKTVALFSPWLRYDIHPVVEAADSAAEYGRAVQTRASV